jgi:hypothetical protein
MDGLNRPAVTPAPRSIAWVARGVVTKRASSGRDRRRGPVGQRQHVPAALGRQLRAGEALEVALGQVGRDDEGDRQRDAPVALGLLQRRGVALEDPLVLLGTPIRRRICPTAPPSVLADGPSSQVWPRSSPALGWVLIGSSAPATTNSS